MINRKNKSIALIVMATFICINLFANEVDDWKKQNPNKNIKDWVKMDIKKWKRNNPNGDKYDYKAFSDLRIKWIKKNPNYTTENFINSREHSNFVNERRVIKKMPKLKGLYLGMSIDELCYLINTKFKNFQCLLFIEDKAYVKDNKIHGLKMMDGSVYYFDYLSPIFISVDTQSKVNAIYIESSFVNEGFNSGQLKGKEFAQLLINKNNKIPKLNAQYQYHIRDIDWTNSSFFTEENYKQFLVYLGLSRNEYTKKIENLLFTGWNYRNLNDGWEIFISEDKSILLKKITKKSNLNFD